MITRRLASNGVRNLYLHDIDDTFHERYEIKSDNTRQGDSAQKRINNGDWCNATTIAAIEHKSYKVLYIEGTEARTSWVLRDAGFEAYDCVPVSIDVSAVYASKKYVYNAFQATPMRTLQLLNSQEKFISVWYDGCQTLKGNVKEDIFPIEEINYILNNNVQSGSILAVTFCTRGHRRGYEQSINVIHNAILNAGYKYTLLNSNSYTGAMSFYMVKLI